MFFKNKELAIIFSILMVVSAFLLLPVPMANAEPFQGNEPSPTNVTLYFHNLSTPVTIGSSASLHIANTLNDSSPQYYKTGSNVSTTHYLTLSFSLYPQLSGNFTINGTIYVWFYFSQNGSSPTAGRINTTLSEISPSGVITTIGSGPSTPTTLSSPGSTPTPILITGPTLNLTVPKNYSLQMSIDLTGSTSEIYGAYWGDVGGTYYYSRAVVPVSSYLCLNRPDLLTSSGNYNGSLSQEIQNKSVELKVNVTDPLGAYDFSQWPVYFTLRNDSNIFLTGKMTAITPYQINEFSRMYEFSFNYSSLTPGSYTIVLNATDNTAHNYENTYGALYGRNATLHIQIYVGLPPVNAKFVVKDSQTRPLYHAEVTLNYGSSLIAMNYTNSIGITTLNVPGGNYTFKVFWQETLVYSSPVSINNISKNFTAISNVYSPSIVFVSVDNLTLPNTLVLIKAPNGTTLPIIATNLSGVLSLEEIAGGTYNMTTYWHDSVVFSSGVQISSNNRSYVTVHAYSQEFTVVDSTGAPVQGANVLVLNASSGLVLAFNTTSQQGISYVVIPYGTYNVEVYWKGIPVFQNSQMLLVNQNQSTVFLNTDIFTVTIVAKTSTGSSLSGALIELTSNSTGSTFFAQTNSTGVAVFTLAAGMYSLQASYIGTFDLTQVSDQVSQNLNVSKNANFGIVFSKVYPSVFSTILFVLILIITAIVVAAVVSVLIIRSKYKNHAKTDK